MLIFEDKFRISKLPESIFCINMKKKLTPGLNLTQTYTIGEEDLASNLKTSRVAYASTASLIIMMEKSIGVMLNDLIGKDFTTVSAEINIKHITPVPAGTEISCSVHLKFIDENKLFFDFAVFDKEEEMLAIGAHERAIVKVVEF